MAIASPASGTRIAPRLPAAYALLLPGFVAFAGFFLVPAALLAWLSGQAWDGLADPVAVGTGNYAALLADDALRAAVVHNLAWVLLGYWSARAIADTFWVWTTDQVFESLGDIFGGVYGDWFGIAFQLLGITSIALLYFLPWAKWLRRFTRRRGADPDAATLSPPAPPAR